MMSMSPFTLRAPARLAAYGVTLAAVLGGGALVGAAFGPEPSKDDPPAHDTHQDAAAGTPVPAALPAGLAVSQDGYRLDLETTTVDPDVPAELRLTIHGPDGRAVTAFDVAHEKELHLVVVSRDLRRYAHVHPERDEHGTWTVTAPPLPAGSYRVYADFVPAGGEGMTLAADLSVPGHYTPRPVPEPSHETTVDGYDVAFEGELVAGQESELTVTVTRDGEPVSDLDPYLGALGHLVAIRDGDLAYLHVHPRGETEGPGGPEVRFAVDVPTAGTYGLYFDFSHGGTVRTASVTASAGAGTGDAPAGDGHADTTGEEHGHD
jgi:hypothetical protein